MNNESKDFHLNNVDSSNIDDLLPTPGPTPLELIKVALTPQTIQRLNSIVEMSGGRFTKSDIIQESLDTYFLQVEIVVKESNDEKTRWLREKGISKEDC